MTAARVRRHSGSWLPLAASIALAAGLGISAGLLTPRRPLVVNAPVPSVSSEELVQTLGLDALGDSLIDLERVLTPDDEQKEDHS
jgi:hypothetical protein